MVPENGAGSIPERHEDCEYEAFKEIVAVVMQKMSDLPEKPVISYSQQIGDIVYNEAGERVCQSRF